MNHLLRPRIWPSLQASSGVGPAHLRGLATAIHEISGLTVNQTNEFGSQISVQGFKNYVFL
jgi:hypothetical protein